MGNTNSTEENNLVASFQQKQQRRRSRSSSSSTSIHKTIQSTTTISSSSSSSSSNTNKQPFQFTLTEPPKTETEPIPVKSNNNSNNNNNNNPHWSPTEPSIQEDNNNNTKEIPIEMKEDNTNNNNEESTPAKAVPVSTGKSGWVSSTGAASPWYGSLSSSTSSSHHRASISGPYYRTRGMSVTRDSENDEDLTNIISNSTASTTAATPPINNTAAQQKPISLTSNQGVPTIITWTQGGNNVFVTGTFNGWKHKIKLIKSTHDFNAVLELPPGTHRLKFIVDDEWKCSNEMETATDPDGNLVNYLQVMDEEEENENDDFGDNDLSTVSSSGSLSNDGKKYSNIIPPELLQLASVSDEIQKSDWEKKQPQPPTLPPHLEKVLLNSNTVSEEDNSVLHVPNHVTLNHLYACSIKDNVMALATTSRYRKKYVTTMYYRPVFPKN